MNYEHPFPRVLGYYRLSDIMGVDTTEFRVYVHGPQCPKPLVNLCKASLTYMS